MGKNTMLGVTIVSLLAVSTTYAQCARGSRGGGSASADFASQITSRGLSGPMGLSNSIGSSPDAVYLAARYRSQLARRRYLLDQQQRYFMTMAQRQRNLESQLTASRRSDPQGTAPREERNPANTRRERVRHENAEKAFELAKLAGASGRVSTAEKNYRKVVRILGDSDPLSRRAADALNELHRSQRDLKNGATLLASKTR